MEGSIAGDELTRIDLESWRSAASTRKTRLTCPSWDQISVEEMLHVGQIVLSIRLSASVKAESMHDLSAPEFLPQVLAAEGRSRMSKG